MVKAPALTPRGRRYRGNNAVSRMNQEAAFAYARRSISSRARIATRGFVVVNAAGKPLCHPTSEDEAQKLRVAAGGRVVPHEKGPAA